MDSMSITSPAFTQAGLIPGKYTCDSENINPEIDIQGIPTKTKTIAVIIDDPDSPNGTFDHWVVWNIEPVKRIPENSLPGIQGLNGAGEHGYIGPCPPSGTHRYFFKVYALDTELDLPADTTKRDLELAMAGHILGTGRLVGLYKKHSTEIEI